MLRKGRSRLLGVILPNLQSKRYAVFLSSFKSCAEENNYNVRIYWPRRNSREEEDALIQQARSDMVEGLALFSGFAKEREQGEAGPMKIVYVERKPSFAADYIGFDFARAGEEMARQILQDGHRRVYVITESLNCSHTEAFYGSLTGVLSAGGCKVSAIQTDQRRQSQNILRGLDHIRPDAVVCSCLDFAQDAQNILATFFQREMPAVYTLSHIFTLPEGHFRKYELNYGQLGNKTARQLIRQIEHQEEELPPAEQLVENTGFRCWAPMPVSHPSTRPLNVLTLDNPAALATRQMAHLYTSYTGVPVNVTISSYDEIYEIFSNLDNDSTFDVLRLDTTWLNWFAEKLLLPLDEIDPTIRTVLDDFLPGTPEHYSYVNGKLYALPYSPSTQLMFYRTDLFSSPICKRTFQ